MRQSDKQNTIKLTKPVSPQPITSIQQIKEDASLWPVIDGVKQKNGFAYCDGSTLDNTSGKYNNFNTANGDLVLPNGPFRTRSIDQTESIITFSNTPAGWDLRGMEAYAFSDDNGQWFLYITLSAIWDNNLSSFTFDIDGITSKQSSLFTYYPGTVFNTSGTVNIQSNSNTLNIGRPTASTALRMTIEFPLQSKPTWADSNLDSPSPVISLYDNIAAGALGLPEATATQAGTVSYYNRVDLVLDNEFTGGTRDITVERIGNTVTITGHGTASHAANATPETSAGFIPSWARPRVTTENVYALEPGRVNAVYVEADGTLSCNYKTWTGADSNAGNVGANRTINIQYNVE